MDGLIRFIQHNATLTVDYTALDKRRVRRGVRSGCVVRVLRLGHTTFHYSDDEMKDTPTTNIKQSSTTDYYNSYEALLNSACLTAGDDSWKTVIGRNHGPETFIISDAWQLFQRKFQLVVNGHGSSCSGSGNKLAVCPVCFEQPKDSNEWHTTISCRHTMCKRCLHIYAICLTNDAGHIGPLRCPCCPRLLRTADARVALEYREQHQRLQTGGGELLYRRKQSLRGGTEHNSESNDDDDDDESAINLLIRWDTKTRNALLRTMDSFRPCPHCSSSNTWSSNNNGGGESDDLVGATALSDDDRSRDNGSGGGGGGFVTPDCLAPINDKRERNAERVLNLAGNPSSLIVVLVYFVFYVNRTNATTNTNINGVDNDQYFIIALQILLTFLPSLLVPIIPHVLRYILALLARRIMTCPICVTCPCCNKEFSLDASSELQQWHNQGLGGGRTEEMATQQWKTINTRPCPNCASPIMKDGGCNHVKCTKCRNEFCWACMQSRSRCLAYQCKNGAPYGNPFGDGSLLAVMTGLNAMERQRNGVGIQNMSLMERIHRVESLSLQNLGLFRLLLPPFNHASTIVIGTICVMSILMLYNTWLFGKFTKSITSLVTSVILLFLLVLAIMSYNIIGRWQRRNNARPNVRNNNNRSITGGDNIILRGQENHVQARNCEVFIEPFWLRGFTEEEQIAEAIARSLIEST